MQIRCKVCHTTIFHGGGTTTAFPRWKHVDSKRDTKHDAVPPAKYCPHCGQLAKVCDATGGIYGFPCARF